MPFPFIKNTPPIIGGRILPFSVPYHYNTHPRQLQPEKMSIHRGFMLYSGVAHAIFA